MKQCSKCTLKKELKEFNKDFRYSLGYKGWCKACESQYNKEYSRSEQGIKTIKDYRRKNKKYIREQKRQRRKSIIRDWVKFFSREYGTPICQICGKKGKVKLKQYIRTISMGIIEYSIFHNS